MLIITFQVNAPVGQAIGVKESLAMDVEQKYGGSVRVVSVEERKPEQMRMNGVLGGRSIYE